MIEPENMPFDEKEGEDAVNNLRQNENSARGARICLKLILPTLSGWTRQRKPRKQPLL